MATVALAIVGSSAAEVNPAGPLQLYVTPATVFAVRLIALPLQTGVFDEIVGAAGVGLTTTGTLAVADVQPVAVRKRLYVPLMPTVALAIVGSSAEDVKLFGPVQL